MDWSGADREFQQAIKLNPSYATAHQWRADALVNTGRLDEARAEEKRALELDPLSVIINWESAHGFYFSRQYDQAIEQERKTLEMDPNFVAAHAELCGAYVPKSMYKESIAECEKAVAISPGNTLTLSRLGYAYAAGGRRAEAQNVLDQLNEISKQRYVPAAYRATVYTALGEKDKAFEWLEKGYEERSLVSAGLSGIKMEPIFDPLRSDPRFADLVRRMNLQP